MHFAFLLCAAKNRNVVLTETTVIKRYDVGHYRNNVIWSGMNERDSFFHEVRVLSHIEREKWKCNYSNQIGSLTNVDFSNFTITTARLGDQVRRRHTGNFLRNIAHLRSFFDCVGVVHCDVTPRNSGIVGKPNFIGKHSGIVVNAMYIFDFDLSYVHADGKPANMSCACTMHKPCLTLNLRDFEGEDISIPDSAGG